ncbi:hypothetical protein [Bacillus sp. FJAT-22090]|uniref:hypothetical protein n=1 Tax=Bacillus sp. FJAT-22090 TaxID=1581038 RepID=UPI00119FFC8C|nr:hypothetical protein [Bacillus sp. FJAT-22090]
MKIKQFLFKSFIASVLLITSSVLFMVSASASVPGCELYRMGETISLNNQLQTNLSDKELQLNESQSDGEITVQGCSGISIKRMTSYDISRTGSTAHSIKGEYGYGSDSKFDLYRTVPDNQVVIVRIQTKEIVDFTHYYVVY